jgi:phage gp45-like
MIEALAKRLNLAIGRGRIKAVDDSGPVQMLQVDLGPTGPDGGSMQTVDQVPMVLHFGFESSPPADTDIVTLHIGGRRTSAIGIGHNSQQYRGRNLPQGDVRMRDIRGAYIWLTAAGPVIDAGGQDVTIQNAANVTVTATTKVTVNAPAVELGGSGGQPVARVGDTVNLTTGVIETGSDVVSST